MRSVNYLGRALAGLLAVILVAFSPGAHAQTAPTFSVSPTSGEGSVTPVATWNVPGASSCMASGGWSGSKAASGTETLPAIVRSTTYSLTCSTGTGAVTLTWTTPTRVTSGYDGYGAKEGANCYWPHWDAAFVGGSDDEFLAKIIPPATLGGQPRLITMNVPPIPVAGNTHEGGPGFGSLHVHPGDPTKLVILETAGQRVWHGTMASQTATTISWTQVANHPFNLTPRVVCSLRGNLGGFWAIGRADGPYNGGQTQSFSQLWRPPL